MINNLKVLFSFLVVTLIILQSCSVEKRHYTSGYHLQWNKGKNNVLSQKTETSLTKVEKEDKDKSLLEGVSAILNTSFNLLIASSEKKKGIVILTSDSTKCDTIIMKDGTEVKAKVLEVTPTEIKYKFCNNIDGPLYVAFRYNISYVKYANGTMDSFVDEHPPVGNGNNGGYRPNNNGGYNQNNRGSFSRNDLNYSKDNFETERYVERLSTKSLVLGLVSLIIGGFGVISAIFAIVRGAEALRLIKQDPSNLWRYRQRAMTGIILGAVFLGLVLLLILALVAAHII